MIEFELTPEEEAQIATAHKEAEELLRRSHAALRNLKGIEARQTREAKDRLDQLNHIL